MANIQKRGESSFLLTVDVGFHKGKRIRKTKTVKIDDKSLLKTKKKLNDHLEKLWYDFKTEVEAGAFITPGKLTLEEFIKEWKSKYALNHLSESTLETYLGHINNHIKPSLGDYRLDQITPMLVLNFLDDLSKKVINEKTQKKLSIGTIQYAYRVLRNIFSRAVEWRILTENPVASVKKPKDVKVRKEQPSIYDEFEVEVLFGKLENEAPHWRMFITLALAAGLRRGELLGLEWQHIDLANGEIHIKQSLGRGEKGRAVLKEPKSKTSIRTISLSRSVLSELNLYYRHCMKERNKVVDLFKETEHNFVFCNEDGTHFYPTTPNTWWKRFTERSKIRYIRLHDLRHTSATLLINQGIHAKIISERLGHADIRITMDTYGHALRSADQEAANKLDELFKKSL